MILKRIWCYVCGLWIRPVSLPSKIICPNCKNEVKEEPDGKENS